MSPVKCEVIDLFNIKGIPGATRTEITPWIIPEGGTKPTHFDFPQSRRPFSLSVFGSGGLWEVTKNRKGKEQGTWKTLPTGHQISYRVGRRTINLTYFLPGTEVNKS